MKDKLIIVEFDSMEDFMEDLIMERVDYEEGIEKLEEEYPDFTIFADEDLESILDYFSEGGFTEEQIIQMNKNRYGNVLDVFEIKNNSYIAMFGAR